MCCSLKSSPTSFSYSLNEHSLSCLNSTQDLGVTFDNKLRFDTHCLDVINRAAKLSGFILRSSSDFVSIQSSLALCISLVRNTLACRNCDCLALENVQRKFTRSLFFKKIFPHVDYPSRLRFLSLHSYNSVDPIWI